MAIRKRALYLVVFLMGGAAILLMDQIEARSFRRLNQEALHAFSGLVKVQTARFFDERVRSVRAGAAMIASTDGKLTPALTKALADLLNPRGLEALVLSDAEGRVADMLVAEADLGPRHDRFLRAQAERLARRTISEKRVLASVVRTPATDSEGVAIFVPIGADQQTRGALGGFFNLYALTAVPAAAGATRTYLVRWITPDGQQLAESAGKPGAYEVTETVKVAGADWTVRIASKPAADHRLLLSRAMNWTVGLLLLLLFLVLFLLMQERTVAYGQANAALERRTQEMGEVNRRLLAANRDLDEFASAVSHDLKEPLRGVEALSKLLLVEYGEHVDDAGREQLEMLHACGTRMTAFIDALREVSRLSRQSYPSQHVDFAELLEEVKHGLAYSIQQRGASVTPRTPLPTVRCDRVRMMRLLSNLIGNAIKFCDKESPEVTLGCRETEDEVLFDLRDNGIGVAVHDVERIFQMFVKLHPPDRYSGTGVGLALCKRIIEKHGGRIWVESSPGKGSTFWFTIPKRPEAAAEPPSAAEASEREGETSRG